MRTCRKCGKDIPTSTAHTGRPAVYCSVTCRRLAEFAIKRLNGQIDDEERRLTRLREESNAPHQYPDFHGRTTAEQIAAAGKTIVELEERLRDLLADDDPEPGEQ